MIALETVNFILALGTLALGVLTAGLLAAYIFRIDIGERIRTWGIWVALLATLGASAMTLIHEHLYGLPPCSLCWWQRIFMYPQAVLFAIALWKHITVAPYSIALSVIGLGIALYHHALQILPAGSIPCPSEGVSCAQIFYLEFGFLTYPLMAAVLFTFLIVLMLFAKKEERS